jgi:C1A family cysteine protease
MVQPIIVEGFGWKPDRPDHRDRIFKVASGLRRNLPSVVDLRPICPSHGDQGKLGSCTAHGITSIIRYALIKSGKLDRPLSRLQLYYDERVIEGTVKEDSGATIRDGIKSSADKGVAPEPLWPYNIDRFTQKPFKNVYDGALKFRALAYERVEPDATSIKAAIASGFPVVGGFNVFEQFLSAQCTYFPAYGQRSGYITSRNSWGPNWGDKGDFYVPEEYLEQQGSDYWIITKVGLQVTNG